MARYEHLAVLVLCLALLGPNVQFLVNSRSFRLRNVKDQESQEKGVDAEQALPGKPGLATAAKTLTKTLKFRSKIANISSKGMATHRDVGGADRNTTNITKAKYAEVKDKEQKAGWQLMLEQALMGEKGEHLNTVNPSVRMANAQKRACTWYDTVYKIRPWETDAAPVQDPISGATLHPMQLVVADLTYTQRKEYENYFGFVPWSQQFSWNDRDKIWVTIPTGGATVHELMKLLNIKLMNRQEQEDFEDKLNREDTTHMNSGESDLRRAQARVQRSRAMEHIYDTIDKTQRFWREKQFKDELVRAIPLWEKSEVVLRDRDEQARFDAVGKPLLEKWTKYQAEVASAGDNDKAPQRPDGPESEFPLVCKEWFMALMRRVSWWGGDRSGYKNYKQSGYDRTMHTFNMYDHDRDGLLREEELQAIYEGIRLQTTWRDSTVSEISSPDLSGKTLQQRRLINQNRPSEHQAKSVGPRFSNALQWWPSKVEDFHKVTVNEKALQLLRTQIFDGIPLMNPGTGWTVLKGMNNWEERNYTSHGETAMLEEDSEVELYNKLAALLEEKAITKDGAIVEPGTADSQSIVIPKQPVLAVDFPDFVEESNWGKSLHWLMKLKPSLPPRQRVNGNIMD